MMKKWILNFACVAVLIGIIAVVMYGNKQGFVTSSKKYEDGIEQINLNEIHLEQSNVDVKFYDVILSNPNEERKLIVSEQSATVSTELNKSLLKQWDVDFLEKKQHIQYTGEGYFVVDLDNLDEKSIDVDRDAKVVTIKIGHAYLRSVDIDPDKIICSEVQKGLLMVGTIKLTAKDFLSIETRIRELLEKEFQTKDNLSEADENALEMVKDIYEPIVKVVDKDYKVNVVFE